MKEKRSKCSLDFSLGLFSQALACESRMEFDLKRQIGQLSLDSQALAQCRQNKEISMMLRMPISIALLLVNMLQILTRRKSIDLDILAII